MFGEKGKLEEYVYFTLLLDHAIQANYANFGHIPYG